MGITLLPCQVEAVEAFVSKRGRMALDARVGSGKSFAAGGCIIRSQAKYPLPALYITIKSALKEQAFKLSSLGLSTFIVDKSFVLGTSQVYLMTPERMVIEAKRLESVEFGIICLDEADMYTGGASKRNKAIVRLKARHKLMMTGTWLKNGLKDSFLPLQFLSFTPPYRNWTDFCSKELLFQNRLLPHAITGVRNEAYLASLLRPFMHKMVNPGAPEELVAEIVPVTLTTVEWEVYERMKKEMLYHAKQGTLAISNQAVLNLRLRQFVAMPRALGIEIESSKEEVLLSLLQKLTGKTMVFTSFATIANLLSERHGWPVITGAMSGKVRNEVLNKEPNISVVTSAVERGLDCPWLTNVVSMDAGFTPATLRQRAGRATRYGRTGEAKLYLLQAAGTVDVTSEARIILKKLRQARKIYGSGK